MFNFGFCLFHLISVPLVLYVFASKTKPSKSEAKNRGLYHAQAVEDVAASVKRSKVRK